MTGLELYEFLSLQTPEALENMEIYVKHNNDGLTYEYVQQEDVKIDEAGDIIIDLTAYC